MKVDDISKWIANEKVRLFQKMQASVTNDEKWDRFKGAYEVLEALQLHILTQTNEHNREDIRKFLNEG